MDADMKANSPNWIADAAAKVVYCLLEVVVELLL